MLPVFLAAVLAVAAPAADIVLCPNPSAAERRAGDELASYLGQVYSMPFAVGPARRGVAHILVGVSRQVRRDCPDIKWDSLGPDEIVVRTVGRDIVVAGGRPRGSLYAGYRLLHELGVRWWTPWATDVPKLDVFRIPSLNIHETTTFEYREPYWFGTFDRDWAARNMVNGFAERLDDSVGGGTTYEGFVHTSYPLVPPAKYFAIHPEWYALINGRRQDHDAQLCTTNPELRNFILDEVRRRLRANPKATIVSVSQNDCFNPCQCERCQALAKAEGSESAPMLALANFVADGIRSEFPKVAVDTLAYQYTRHAPRTLRPRPNVIVRLCSIECDFGGPFTRVRNADFARDIQDWSRLTNRLYVWDYVTNFAHYIQPLPDVDVLGPNLAFFAAHGVKGVFEEGDHNSNGGDISELKAWMLARLTWNPKLDPRALRDEFLSGYYGRAAAVPIGRYLDLMASAGERTGAHLYDGPGAAYLDYATMRQAEQLWQEAEAASAADPEKRWRVRISHLPVRYVWLCRWDEFKKAAAAHGDRWPLRDDRPAEAQDWLELATGPGPKGWTPISAVNEGNLSPQAFVAGLR